MKYLFLLFFMALTSGCAYQRHFSQSPLVYEGDFNAQQPLVIVNRGGRTFILETTEKNK